MSKPKISVEVTQDQYDVLNEEAKGVGKTLSALVRDRLFPEAVEEVPAVSVPVQARPPVGGPRHPCRYLLKVFPMNYGPSQCQGTCGHQDERKRPCFWMSNTAGSCGKFEPHNIRLR
jgi:hypothetical protein